MKRAFLVGCWCDALGVALRCSESGPFTPAGGWQPGCGRSRQRRRKVWAKSAELVGASGFFDD